MQGESTEFGSGSSFISRRGAEIMGIELPFFNDEPTVDST
jgi:hypothetical protein